MIIHTRLHPNSILLLSLSLSRQFLDHESFYLSFDNQLLVDLIHTDLSYLKSNWRLIGRPTIVFPILHSMLGEECKWETSPIFKLLLVLASGYSSGVRVQLGTMKDFYSTASIKNLSFVDPSEASEFAYSCWPSCY